AAGRGLRDPQQEDKKALHVVTPPVRRSGFAPRCCGDARPVASPVLAAAIKSLRRASDNCTPRAACDATPGNAQSGRGLISRRTLFIFRKPMATTPETPEPAEDVTPYAPAPPVAHVSLLRRLT